MRQTLLLQDHIQNSSVISILSQLANNKYQKNIAEMTDDINKLICKWQDGCSVHHDLYVAHSSYIDQDLLFCHIKEFRFIIFVNTNLDSFFIKCKFNKWIMRNAKHFTDIIFGGNVVYYQPITGGIKLFLDKDAIEIDLIFVALNDKNNSFAVVRD